MRFLLGGVVVVLIVLVVGIGLALLGFFPTNANSTPPRFEQQIAMAALDASMERRAPRVNNPRSPTVTRWEVSLPSLPESYPSSTRRPRVARLLCNSDRRALHRDAGLGQNFVRIRHLESDGVSYAGGEVASSSSGFLAEISGSRCTR